VIRERTEQDLIACAAALRSVHETDRYPHTWPRDVVDWLQPPRQRRAWVALVHSTWERRADGDGDDVRGTTSGSAGDGGGGHDAGARTNATIRRREVVGHVAVNTAAGDAALEVSTRGAGLPAEGLMVISRLFVVRAFRRH